MHPVQEIGPLLHNVRHTRDVDVPHVLQLGEIDSLESTEYRCLRNSWNIAGLILLYEYRVDHHDTNEYL